jgi:hypothetical protein
VIIQASGHPRARRGIRLFALMETANAAVIQRRGNSGSGSLAEASGRWGRWTGYPPNKVVPALRRSLRGSPYGCPACVRGSADH